MRKIAFIITLAGVFSIDNGFAQPLINEIMSANINSIQDEYDGDEQNCPVPDCHWWYEQMGRSTQDGDYPDWIEIYNPETESINLAGYGLSDNPSNPYKWIFPYEILDPGEHLLVFASGKDRREPHEVEIYMHTNFKIDRLGEKLILTDDTGVICDSIFTGEIPINFSMGRYPDGETEWVIFAQPTPTASNATPPFPGFTDAVQISDSGGFYSSAISLSLSADSPTAEIRYTLNGYVPTPTSNLYISPIFIDNTTVVKARTFENGIFSSKILTQTYFIDEDFTMPVISLSTIPDNLWDAEYGIYVPGNNADEANRVANYWQDWERPVHVEFYEPDGLRGFSIDAGIRIFGWGSRENALKSLAIMIRDRYGHAELNYPIFPDLRITKFKSFVLRAAGTDWQGTYFRDPFASSLVNDKNLDMQAFRPAIVFLNGEYWGIHNIREKLNEDYLASHHSIDKDNVDIISRYWRRTCPVIIEGDDQAYLAMEDYLENYDLNDSKNYEYIKTIMDVDNYVNYCVAQIYFANYDWPGNNNKCWRARMPNSKWRWFLYDLDWTFNYSSGAEVEYNTLAHAIEPNMPGWPNPPQTTFLLRKMFASEQFRNDFINRSADFMNTIFIEDTLLTKIEEMKALFEPEMERHINKWGQFGNYPEPLINWENNIDEVRDFAKKRTFYVRRHICDTFNLSGWETLELDISHIGGGKIKINSIIIDEYPWNGDYFLGIPIQVAALPNSGYRFTGWKGLSSVDSLANPIMVNLSGDLSLTACFEEDNNSSAAILFNEINYNSSTDFDPEDWVELYNPQGNPIDISRWIFTDGDDLHVFSIPENTIIPAAGYFVLCRDVTAFHELFPSVNNYVGYFNFGLRSTGELIRLFNDQNLIIDSLTYCNVEPWPKEPDGNGPTLSLRAPHLDNSVPQNWASSLGYGTPGAANDLSSSEYIPTADVPASFSLGQNYPNPFNSVTNIGYSIPSKCIVRMSIYNIHGREVATLFDEVVFAGNYTFTFNASNLASGLYFYRLEAGSHTATKKMLFLK